MNIYLRTISGICVLLVLFFTANAMAIGNDNRKALVISQVNISSQKSQLLETLPKPESVTSISVSNGEKPQTSRQNANNDHSGDLGSSAIVILAFAFMMLVSSRRRQI